MPTNSKFKFADLKVGSKFKFEDKEFTIVSQHEELTRDLEDQLVPDPSLSGWLAESESEEFRKRLLVTEVNFTALALTDFTP